MGQRGEGWTVLFVRQDGTQSHALRLSWKRWGLAAIGLALVCAAIGGAAGRYWGLAAESSRVASLEAEVARLRAERAQLAELANQLETIEDRYRRIQRAMSGEVARSGRDVALPGPVGAPRPWPAGPQAEGEMGTPNAWPLVERGFVTRAFGSVGVGSESGHPGIDIAVPVGSYVRASGGGVVTAAGRDQVYGDYVRIAHAAGVSSLYGHNSWLFVGVGDSVARLEVIALSGNTGQSTAPHLHFEIEDAGVAVDPLTYVSSGR